MKYIIRFIIFGLLLLFTATYSRASLFKELSVQEGLSNRKVFASAKDHKGYMWFATRSGINRYNGEHFNFYELPQRNDRENERPIGIVADKDGMIYTFGENTIYQYNEKIDSLHILSHFSIPHRERINVLFFTDNNHLIVGTSEGLYLLNGEQHKIELGNTLAVFCIAQGEDKTIWLGTSDGVIKLKENIDFQYSHLSEHKLDPVKGKRIQNLYYDELTKYLWIGTFSSGLYIYDTNGKVFLETEQLTLSFPIRSITHTTENKIWAGIDGGGIFEFNRFTAKLEVRYSQSGTGNYRLPANNIYHILNGEKSIWICTYSAGIFIYNKEEFIRKTYKSIENDPQSLNNNHVNTILEDSSGELWMGTNRGLSRYNDETGSWKHYFQHGTSPSVILSLCEDHENSIWAGGYASDIYRIRKNGTIEIVNIPKRGNNNRSKNYIYSIIQDRDKNIWMGGISDGLTVYNFKTNTFKQYSIQSIHKIIDYNPDSLLIATTKGIFFFNKKEEKESPVNLKGLSQIPGQLSFPSVYTACVDPTDEAVIWFGTEGQGIYRYDVQKQELKQYTTKDGLSSNNICGIQSDVLKRLWISTENGLNCFNVQNSKIDVFYEMDGLPNNILNYRSYAERKNNRIVWGTPDGAFEIVPEKFIEKHDQMFNLRFEAFSLFYEKVVANAPKSPLSQSIDDTEYIKLKHDQHSFSFDFINVSYFNTSRHLYTWKLEGFDEQWSVASDMHRAVYTNIPPGNYTFKVKVFRADNEEVFALREIKVKMTPPIWATSYALVGYLILFLLLAYFLLRAYKNRLDAKDSDQKIRFFVNIAHDIRTPLTLIKAPLNEIESEELSANGHSAVQLAKKNTEKLLNMVTQLLDFQKVEREAMNLQIEATNLNQYLENCINNFQLLAKEKQLTLQYELPDYKEEAYIDRRKITLILDNLLSNAIKYTDQYGNIFLRFSVNNRVLRMEITDDGIGISAQAQKKLFNRFYRAENAANSTETGSGIGLLLTKKMVQLHKGSISVSSMEGVGTTFEVNIPIDRNSYSKTEIIEPENTPRRIEDEQPNNENIHAIKILLVEDNNELRTYLARFLQKKYIVEEAVNGEEALEKVRKINPDFIISDVLMPVLSGTELCNRLKSNIETCHIPIILLTSLSEREDVIKGLNAGADDYITKPFDLPILESKISSIIKNRALYRKKYIDKSAFEDESIVASDLDKQFMKQVVEYIEEQIVNEDFSIDYLAMEMAMSRSVFYKKLKSLTGQNPKDLIRDIKMKKAVILLRDKKYSIGEIAYLTGHPNAKYFSTAFKKYYGTTPSGFIEEEHEKINTESSNP